jgi:hypothetical protein
MTLFKENSRYIQGKRAARWIFIPTKGGKKYCGKGVVLPTHIMKKKPDHSR